MPFPAKKNYVFFQSSILFNILKLQKGVLYMKYLISIYLKFIILLTYSVAHSD